MLLPSSILPWPHLMSLPRCPSLQQLFYRLLTAFQTLARATDKLLSAVLQAVAFSPMRTHCCSVHSSHHILNPTQAWYPCYHLLHSTAARMGYVIPLLLSLVSQGSCWEAAVQRFGLVNPCRALLRATLSLPPACQGTAAHEKPTGTHFYLRFTIRKAFSQH